MKIEDLRIGQTVYLNKDNCFSKKPYTIVSLYGKTKKVLLSNKMTIHCDFLSSNPITQKKRFWLWTILYNQDVMEKSTFYLDDQGFDTENVKLISSDRLLKKHVDEYIEIDV